MVDSIPDCPVCLQVCSYPVQLSCGHIFCFLCIKGVIFRSKRCALCRQDVNLDYFEHPVIVKAQNKTKPCEEVPCTGQDERYQWYYEGRNGWWQYDESSSTELEKAQRESKRSCELLIAGFLYFIDFENMVQFRKTEPGRRRRIKRDVLDAEKKGVAGLRIACETRASESSVDTNTSVTTTTVNAATSVTTVASSVENDNRNCNSSSVTDTNISEVLPVERLVIGSSSDEEGQSASTNQKPKK